MSTSATSFARFSPLHLTCLSMARANSQTRIRRAHLTKCRRPVHKLIDIGHEKKSPFQGGGRLNAIKGDESFLWHFTSPFKKKNVLSSTIEASIVS